MGRQLSADGDASGLVAGKLMGLDSIVVPDDKLPRRRRLPISPEPILVDGIVCTDGLQSIVDIAPFVDDVVFEHALESGLRQGRFKLEELESIVPLLTNSRTAGSPASSAS